MQPSFRTPVALSKRKHTCLVTEGKDIMNIVGPTNEEAKQARTQHNGSSNAEDFGVYLICRGNCLHRGVMDFRLVFSEEANRCHGPTSLAIDDMLWNVAGSD
jgi:hypothetical protein